MHLLVEGGGWSGWGPRLDVSVCEAQAAELIMGQQFRVGGGRVLTLKATR